jgi:NAD(P)-dependent dehydrogenase (short-subunit alcohol dehydrogenase family)
MTGPLASKVVIVTGGAAGIGRAVAGRVVSDGGAVVIGGRRRDTGESGRPGSCARAAAARSLPAPFITGAALAIDGGATAQ